MKMLVFERPFQRDLVEPCKPTNNFSRGPKGFSLKKWQPQKILKICFIAYHTQYCVKNFAVRYSTAILTPMCDIAQF